VDICQGHENGMTMRELGARWHCNFYDLRSAIELGGEGRRPQGFRLGKKAAAARVKIAKNLASGQSASEIARAFGISRQAISRRIQCMIRFMSGNPNAKIEKIWFPDMQGYLAGKSARLKAKKEKTHA
jgi:hypothetical protein